jgi:hypothetical protein
MIDKNSTMNLAQFLVYIEWSACKSDLAQLVCMGALPGYLAGTIFPKFVENIECPLSTVQ